MAIFSVIGMALITLLRQSTAFLEKGQSGSELHDIVDAADAMLADDFANIVVRSATTEGEPDVRLYADRISFRNDEKATEGGDAPAAPRGSPGAVTHVPRLMFVRSVPGELTDPAMRDAGSKVGAQGRLDGFEDDRETEESDLRAPAGKMEVMLTLLPGKGDERGVGTLYRGARTPIGGKESFLPWEPWHDNAKPSSRMGVHTREAIEERLRPVANGVLHLSFAFWSRHTRLADARILVDGEPPRTTPPSVDGGGLSTTWDSTRGILPASGLVSFFLARGGASLADPLDDIFPNRIRVTLVLQRIGRDARSADLAQNLSDGDTEVMVEDTSFAPGGDPLSRYIKIDDEWMRWSSRTSRSFQIAERGARGTSKASHEAGAQVHAGAALVRDYRIPVYKEDWND